MSGFDDPGFFDPDTQHIYSPEASDHQQETFMNDTFWQSVRYLLIGVGGYFAGRGKIDPAQVAPFADQIINILSGAAAVGAAAWGFYVKWRTRAVPERVAARIDVPTVSAATGAVQ